MTTQSGTSEVIKVDEKLNFQKILNSIRSEVLNSRKDISINDKLKSGAMALDFMFEKYELDHMKVIKYMGSSEAKKLMLNQVPENGRGYIQFFVKHIGNLFNPYGVKFIPYNIIQKEWGLGYKDTKTDDFVFFECLYENDHTKFRGCFRK
jgi:hypothetical protein